ncbi:hypothetical protein [Aeromonas jandaei]|uniref:hypothetical protein n=1 Tax=Aeromonas jandaei TaxID=650 RepID=UPI00059BB38C|nr:hypothetical protein [Aeromonas jandaei]
MKGVLHACVPAGEGHLQGLYKPFKKYALRKMRLSTLRIVTAGASRIAQYSVPFAAISGNGGVRDKTGRSNDEKATAYGGGLSIKWVKQSDRVGAQA